MTEFEAPQSRNEAIIQNILGAENVLPEPQSRIEELLQEILQQGSGGGSKLYVHHVTCHVTMPVASKYEVRAYVDFDICILSTASTALGNSKALKEILSSCNLEVPARVSSAIIAGETYANYKLEIDNVFITANGSTSLHPLVVYGAFRLKDENGDFFSEERGSFTTTLVTISDIVRELQ